MLREDYYQLAASTGGVLLHMRTIDAVRSTWKLEIQGAKCTELLRVAIFANQENISLTISGEESVGRLTRAVFMRKDFGDHRSTGVLTERSTASHVQ